MATNRDTSKQKRARQNRAQRQALKARTTAASQPASERRSKAVASAADASPPAPKKGGFFSGGGGQRPVRPGDVPVDIETLEGNWLAKRMKVPGGRHVISALVLSVLLSIMLAFQRFPPEGNPDGKATETIFDLLGPLGWVLLLYPVVLVGIAAQFTLSPKRRRIWLACTVMLGAAVIALLQLYIVHLIVVGYLIFAMQKAARVEGPMRGPRAASADTAEATADDTTADEPDADDAPAR